MAHVIDITSKLEAAKPVMQHGLLSEDEDSFNQMVAALEALFGKDKLKEIEQDNPGITTRVSLIQVLFKSILAAVEGVSYEVVEARFRTEGS